MDDKKVHGHSFRAGGSTGDCRGFGTLCSMLVKAMANTGTGCR